MTAISVEQAHYRYEQAQLRRRCATAKIQRSNTSSWTSSPAFIIGLSLVLMAVIAFFAALIHMTASMTASMTADAFQIAPELYSHRRHRSSSSSTRIFLEDWVAEMIDGELYREQHIKEYEGKWMEKNRGAVLSQLADSPSSMLSDDEDHRRAFAEHKRDERMAFLKPQKYCADRCVATGNCDIFEDFYELGPEDVLKFCEECVLFDENDIDTSTESDGGERVSACQVPDAFYEKEPPLRP